MLGRLSANPQIARPEMSAMLPDDPTSHDDGPVFVAKLTRRGALGAFAALGVGLLAACGGDDDSSAATTVPGTSATASPTSVGTRSATTAPATTAASGTAAATYLDFPE